MSDRTSVKLVVATKHSESVEKLIGDHCVSFDERIEPDYSPEIIPTIEYCFHDITSTDLGIESLLQEAGICYDKIWDASSKHKGGAEYHRNTSNGGSMVRIFEDDHEDAVKLDDLVEAYSSNTVYKLIERKEEERQIRSWAIKDCDDLKSTLSSIPEIFRSEADCAKAKAVLNSQQGQKLIDKSKADAASFVFALGDGEINQKVAHQLTAEEIYNAVIDNRSLTFTVAGQGFSVMPYYQDLSDESAMTLLGDLQATMETFLLEAASKP